jgi:hypothetical protein
MKRLLVLSVLFASLVFMIPYQADAQTRYTKYAYSLDTLKSSGDTASFISPAFDDYYDIISLQLVPVLYSTGDSARFTVRYYQSNMASHAYWTELDLSTRDTLTGAFAKDKGILYNDYDFEGTWLKAKVYSTVVRDSFKVKAFWEMKKSKEAIF